MSVDYHRKRGKYRLPRCVYHTTLWRVRDYERLKFLADDLIQSKKESDVGPKAKNLIQDKVGDTVVKREKYMDEVFAIERALSRIPEEYKEGVWNNITKNKAFPIDADRTTYSRWKARFLMEVAKELNLI